MTNFLTDPERTLFAGIIVAGAVQLLKMWTPLVNGWGAVFTNAVITAGTVAAVFHLEPTWNTVAVCFTVGFIAAGIHGTVTKLSDYPSPQENPTPSGDPTRSLDGL